MWLVNICFVHEKSFDEIKIIKKYMYALLHFRVGSAQNKHCNSGFLAFFEKLSADFKQPYSEQRFQYRM